jgi:hypothetical protein
MDISIPGCCPFYIAAPSHTFVGDAGCLLGGRLVFLRLVHGISRRYGLNLPPVYYDGVAPSRSGVMESGARDSPYKGRWKCRTSITSCPRSGMSAKQCTRIVLNERPITDITPTTFRTEHVPFDFRPGPGEVLVQVNWLSLDPAMRGWLRDARSYLPPVQVGEVMRSIGLATVVKAGEGCRLLVPGDVVSCMPGR